MIETAKEKEQPIVAKRKTRQLSSSTSYDSEFVYFFEEMKKKYPEEVFNIQGISNKARDLNEFTKRFFSNGDEVVADVSVDQNANVGTKTVSQYIMEHNKANQRLNGMYMLWRSILNNEIAEKKNRDEAAFVANDCIERILNGELFVNDLANVEKPYCWAQSLDILVNKGMDFISRDIKIGSPKRPISFLHLVVQFLAYATNQFVGAVSLPDLFVYLDWFYRSEYGEDYIVDFDSTLTVKDEIQNDFQYFIYSCNFEYRTSQSMFVNVSIMDRMFLRSLFEDKLYPDGTKPNFESIDKLGRRFFEYFSKINMTDGIFTFPVITLACSVFEGAYGDEEFVEWTCQANAEKGLGNIYTGSPTSLSSCCRLRSDVKNVEYQNSFGVGGISIGSHRVCGINLPRLWKDTYNGSVDDKKFFLILDERLECVKKILEAHRSMMEHNIAVKTLPLYTYDWAFLSRQYSTIGIIGVHELQHYKNESIGKTDDESKFVNFDFAFKCLRNISGKASSWSKPGRSFNLEQIPGESMAARLAAVDKVLNKNDEFQLYSNQYIPLTVKNVSILERFKIQGRFDSLTSGGSILHINIDESCQLDPKQLKLFFDAALKTETVYWAINYVYVRCDNDHFFVGSSEAKKCPVCGSENLTNYTRVVGFITPVKNWIEVRREWEFKNRKFYGKNDALS